LIKSKIRLGIPVLQESARSQTTKVRDDTLYDLPLNNDYEKDINSRRVYKVRAKGSSGYAREKRVL
jgi:hypothetical protein